MTEVVTAEQACRELAQGLADEVTGYLNEANWLPVEFITNEGACIHALVQDLFGNTRSVTIQVAVEDWLPDCGSKEWT